MENLFTGTWEVVSLYRKIGQGWVVRYIYGNNNRKNFIWEFGEARKQVSSSGRMTYEGTLTEYWKWFEPAERIYAYYPADNLLYVDRSDYEPDGFVSLCIEDQYRVEQINDTEYWLYDLEEVYREPDDYQFRMKIQAIKKPL